MRTRAAGRIETLTPKSVKKKLKQPSFAAGVHRDEVYAGAELLGVELDEHIQTVTDAMKPIAASSGCGRRRTRHERAFEAVGVVVADMARALAFYGLLGLEFPDGAGSVGTPRRRWRAFASCSTPRRRSGRSTRSGSRPRAGTGSRRRSAATSPAEVDETYRRLLDAGGYGHKEPWDAFWGMRYAEVKDPDGNTVDLFADL